MDVFEVFDALTLYGADIAALSVLTCAVVQILKRTLLKKCPKKVLTFLPYILGFIFCAAFAAVSELNVNFIFEHLPETGERGFMVGSLSTLLYVWYEQFIRQKNDCGKTEGVIATLIEGYVPADDVQKTAKSIAEAISRDVTGDGAKKTQKILSEAVGGETGERDVAMLAKLIIETLAHINAGGESGA